MHGMKTTAKRQTISNFLAPKFISSLVCCHSLNRLYFAATTSSEKRSVFILEFSYTTNIKMVQEEIPSQYTGFSFENVQRNQMLLGKGLAPPRATKTGTTIVGLIFDGGVVLGADTRATEGSIVCDKNCSKIHFLADNMYCCGAGTAADTMKVTDMVSSQLTLLKLNTGREVRLATANRILKQYLFKYQGHVGAALVLGGVDAVGPHIYSIFPHGSTDKVPYATLGSGSLAAMAVFESRWRPNLSEAEAKEIVSEAIQAGIFNDLGSGSNVDLCVIRRGSVEYIRPYFEANKKGVRQGSYRYRPGTTAVSSTRTIPLVVEETMVRRPVESMDI